MMQMRWLKDPKALPIYDIGEELWVLQYRYRTNMDDTGATYIIWSDWQDVPTVTEEVKVGPDARNPEV